MCRTPVILTACYRSVYRSCYQHISTFKFVDTLKIILFFFSVLTASFPLFSFFFKVTLYSGELASSLKLNITCVHIDLTAKSVRPENTRAADAV